MTGEGVAGGASLASVGGTVFEIPELVFDDNDPAGATIDEAPTASEFEEMVTG